MNTNTDEKDELFNITDTSNILISKKTQIISSCNISDISDISNISDISDISDISNISDINNNNVNDNNVNDNNVNDNNNDDDISDNINDDISDGINDGINDDISDGISDDINDDINDNINDDINDDINDNNDINLLHPLYIIYNEQKEINEEIQLLNYHKNKDYGYWKIAKMIIAHSTKDKNNTEFFLDSLDIELYKNNDKLENIEKVFYKNNVDIDTVYEFEGNIAMFIVENLKIFKFKSIGYLFNKDINQNKWDFTISVITSKNIYTINRYINENQLGFY